MLPEFPQKSWRQKHPETPKDEHEIPWVEISGWRKFRGQKLPRVKIPVGKKNPWKETSMDGGKNPKNWERGEKTREFSSQRAANPEIIPTPPKAEFPHSQILFFWNLCGNFPGFWRLPGFFYLFFFFPNPSGAATPAAPHPSPPSLPPSIHTWIQLFPGKSSSAAAPLKRIPRQKVEKKNPKKSSHKKPQGAWRVFQQEVWECLQLEPVAELLALRKNAFFPRFFPRFFPVFPGFPPSLARLDSRWDPTRNERCLGVAFSKEKRREKAEKEPQKIHPSPPEQNGRSRRISSWN